MIYQNKVGKPKAETAYSKALLRSDEQTIMAGLERYVTKTDDRQWCNPATWLNQDRWADLPVAVARGSPQKSNGIAGVFSNLVKEFDNAELRSQPSVPSVQQTILHFPVTNGGKQS